MGSKITNYKVKSSLIQQIEINKYYLKNKKQKGVDRKLILLKWLVSTTLTLIIQNNEKNKETLKNVLQYLGFIVKNPHLISIQLPKAIYRGFKAK
jgi:hypothetical protein